MAPHDLVRLLTDKGVLTDQRVAGAMATVPRELFVPEDRRAEAYTDTVLVTKWDETGVAISSASQPAMVAIMLEQLRLAGGHSVLEIGAGTGYNAALLGRLADRVVTVDIDEEIARQARERLAGVGNVEVRVGDGWAGAPDRAPYDRIELTIGTSDISAAWRDQLADGGLLVLPLWLRVGVQLSVAFRRDGEVLRGESVRDCGFQRLRGPHSGPEGFAAIGGGEFVVLDDASEAGPLRTLLRRTPREERAPLIDPSVFARLALDEPRTLAISDLSGGLRPGLYDAGSAVVIDGDRMLTYGSPTSRDRLIYGLGTARPLDRSRLRVTASFGTPPPPSQGWRFVRPSCVVDVAEG
ncbi:methyltransferase domain-containing protein [Actinomadura sp. DC4]|uniref:protein-L-isoaspartate O-methyltransferase family protein n=1 Tax=Actinomadura sp. DC4 TaxID=3055069 RepID=UPI0025B23D86|nr:methyltransferase domain-containing protein [Actinomadura sp. DC4]MDN3360054.1 methyltransferase domain-containing protein [Actinomadura sp. DC4]